MNTSVNYNNLTWANLAHAGWKARVVARKGTDAAEVAFATPVGGEVRRLVSIDRLGRALRGRLELDHPLKRVVGRRIRIS